MSYNLVIQTEALLDIQEAFEWYEKKREGLGYLLIEEIEICYRNLSDHPYHYSYINKQYRRIKVNRFPYLIIYEIESDEIIINSVRHAKRKSKF
jgi:toxin ParE1/3/4